MRNLHHNLFLLAIITLIFTLSHNQSQAAPLSQGRSPAENASDMLARLSPNERIGQLFLVTFSGTGVGNDSQIYQLVTQNHLGGIVLSSENNNFTGGDDNLNNARLLINQIQINRHSASLPEQSDPFISVPLLSTFIPLFVGITQGGDGAPYDQILNGLTPLPSQLAIGATWEPKYAHDVGEIAGAELRAIGINLLFGPSLDVLEIPRSDGVGDLNVSVFGGDPFWVGEMGKAYVAGIHAGSQNRISVVGTHFPGLGSADRLPTTEVATVRKSLEQLKQIELAPFFAVTGNASNQFEQVDALLTSHIRYQGLQGNIRSTTRPISFDQQALNLLMELPPLESWRSKGGVMISDDLGSPAVRRFYDPSEETFNARKLALDAFLAGNDLLFVNNFIATEDPDTFTTITGTLNFFTQKYIEDPLFALRVDSSVLRILTLKFSMYNNFELSTVVSSDDLSDIGSPEAIQITHEIAQRSATLISPPLSELDNAFPSSPSRTDRIVFITDNFSAQQCFECPIMPVLNTQALEQAVLNLYGPDAGGQSSRYYIDSYSSEQLIDTIDKKIDTQEIELTLRRAQWIVFTTLSIDPDRPESQALRRFLAERPDLTRNKNIIVFAANAPYYLDATDISKLTAYFGLYSKTSPYIDTAARLLFKELSVPTGALPVSVPGIGYNLIAATSPSAQQIFTLKVNVLNSDQVESTPDHEDAAISEYQLGDIIELITGKIIDNNGNPVPDDTPVQFIATINGQEELALTTTTIDGFATIQYAFDKSGTITIRAQCEPAISTELLFEIPPQENILVPTDKPTEIPVITPSPEVTEPAVLPPIESSSNPLINLADWLITLLIVAIVAWSATFTGARYGHVRQGANWGLFAIISGLLTYIYISLVLPGSEWAMETSGHWGIFVLTFLGAMLGWGLGYLTQK